VHLAAVADAVRRVEAQPIEVELFDPVRRVARVELAYRLRVRAVEVDRIAPLGRLVVAKVMRRIAGQPVAVGAEVVVDDVEDDGESARMRGIDEAAEIGGRAVKPRGRVEAHAVVAPAELADEVGDRHDLDDGDPEIGEVVEPRHGGGEGAFGRVRADVHLVDHLARQLHALPVPVVPGEGGRVDDARRAVRPGRLIARRRIGQRLAVVDSIAIKCTCRDTVDLRRPVAAVLACKEMGLGAACAGALLARCVDGPLDHDLDPVVPGRPHTKMHASVGHDLGPDRQPARRRRGNGRRRG
jgi:hypothetical protein